TDALAKNANVIEELGSNTGNINKIITDAKDMMARLNAASVRVEGIMEKADRLLSSDDKDGMVAQAKATLESIRQVADNLDKRLAPIAGNIERFSGQGLRDVQALVVDSRRAVMR